MMNPASDIEHDFPDRISTRPEFANLVDRDFSQLCLSIAPIKLSHRLTLDRTAKKEDLHVD